jgi:hypothetical protein
MLIFIILTLVVALLLYVGLQVETGRRKPKPKDKFFPLFGRNIDYVLGVSGIFVAIGIVLDALGITKESTVVVAIGLLLIVLGIVRAYLPPQQFGPAWMRKKDKF